MADLFLVRHGQASFGAADYDKLSPLGATQARLLGQWLNLCGITPDLVATGGAVRQVRTAEHCIDASGGPDRAAWLTLDGLAEYDHDTIVARFRPDYADAAVMHADLAKSGNPRRAFQAMYAQAVARWVGGQHDADYAEPWPAFRARAIAAIERLAAEPARCLVAVTSGGPITAIVQHLLHVPDSHAFEINWALVNAGLTRLRFSRERGSISLATLNAHPHLDQAGDPGLITYR